MAAGKSLISPIVRAIADAERETTGEIRVHLSRNPFERDPFGAALKIFRAFGMERTRERNGVLIYLNLARREVALLADEGIHEAAGEQYWQGLLEMLKDDLKSTHRERAIVLAVRTIGATLARYYPRDLEA
jgi:uncharacterized membrane protein